MRPKKGLRCSEGAALEIFLRNIEKKCLITMQYKVISFKKRGQNFPRMFPSATDFKYIKITGFLAEIPHLWQFNPCHGGGAIIFRRGENSKKNRLDFSRSIYFQPNLTNLTLEPLNVRLSSFP